MLALSRKPGQSLVIANRIEITVVEIRGDQVRLAVNAPREIPVFRKEIYEQVQDENRRAADLPADFSLDEVLGLWDDAKEK